ncbi:NfeD family protein [Vibrio gallicus]|uniref:NfeD family protein n=1 Tax=Vibrio gallicus TaxID=190897 RepID=UPI0021C2B3A6|nr:NfeD family protein [Vibrio gallicus]
MIELLSQINFWHWLAFGLILLCVELLGTAGYFLWLGLSALIVGLLLSFLPLSWQMQLMSFASFSLVTTWLWWRYQSKRDIKSHQTSTLNQRSKQLIGETTILTQAFAVGKGRIHLGDTSWSAVSEQSLAQGTRVEVYKVEGIVLHIRAID